MYKMTKRILWLALCCVSLLGPVYADTANDPPTLAQETPFGLMSHDQGLLGIWSNFPAQLLHHDPSISADSFILIPQYLEGMVTGKQSRH